ncbi:MAG: chorismate-binding protein [Kiritimatiellales bacterium]|nr:chorismate-binding protein [Kiritimatiellota bacterium]MBL7012698.1 chorismate-binding protein [Kiritimatiellales bacterium]
MNCLIQHGDDWLSFKDPVEVLTARTPDEVFQCLEKIEASGLWAAGFVSYEAAGAFDDALKTHQPGDLPLLQFGLFQTLGKISPESNGEYRLGEWIPSVSRDEYSKVIAAIKEHIAAGNTYQVNYTFRLNADFEGDPFSFFCDLAAAQQGRYGAYIETDDVAICSASPELFFELKDGTITSRPMKGTLPRGLTFSDDCKQREVLQNSPKDRAENIMIVDMIRNDIGRVAEAGSVETLSRFDVEKYPTVWQMTSTVRGRLQPRMNANRAPGELGSANAGQQSGNEREKLGEIMRALFPCASITGAPKAKTMELIQGLEKGPRGIYTGSIGFIAPDGTAQFNVAIRTAVVDRSSGVVEYGIGGGIVWDSDSESEYEEALSKAAILTKRMPPLELLETMLWEGGEIFLLERHLKRLAESADYFDFQIDSEKIRAELAALSFDEPQRIRLLLNRDGVISIRHQPNHTFERVIRLAIAKEPIDSGDVFLYHKTTNRAAYERAKVDFPEADDVLLYNERGEVTESCIANVVVELDGHKITPPVSCGLLAGTFRDELLERGEIEEGIVMLDDLKRADFIWLINSVRKWRKAILA